MGVGRKSRFRSRMLGRTYSHGPNLGVRNLKEHGQGDEKTCAWEADA